MQIWALRGWVTQGEPVARCQHMPLASERLQPPTLGEHFLAHSGWDRLLALLTQNSAPSRSVYSHVFFHFKIFLSMFPKLDCYTSLHDAVMRFFNPTFWNLQNLGGATVKGGKIGIPEALAQWPQLLSYFSLLCINTAALFVRLATFHEPCFNKETSATGIQLQFASCCESLRQPIKREYWLSESTRYSNWCDTSIHFQLVSWSSRLPSINNS